MASDLLTTSEDEIVNALKNGFGSKDRLGYISLSSGNPLFRLFKKQHFCTSSILELKTAIKLGYKLEGVVGFASNLAFVNSAPIYSLKIGGRFCYTSSMDELVSLTQGGWIPHEMVGHIHKFQTPTTVPLYRLKK